MVVEAGVSIIIALVGVIATFATIKSKVDGILIRVDAFGKKIDQHSEILAEHKIKIAQAPTTEFVDNRYVSKELFISFEKHLDDKLESINRGLDGRFESLEKSIMSAIERVENGKG